MGFLSNGCNILETLASKLPYARWGLKEKNMYKDGFVLSILKDGRPLKEIDGVARIPFDSEYKVRLRNKK